MTLERELSPDTSFPLTNQAGTYAHSLPTVRYGHWTHFGWVHWSFHVISHQVVYFEEIWNQRERLKFQLLAGAGWSIDALLLSLLLLYLLFTLYCYYNTLFSWCVSRACWQLRERATVRVLDMPVRILQLRLLWQTYHWRGQRRTDRYDRYYLGTFRDMQLCMDLQDSNGFVFEHVRRWLGHFSIFLSGLSRQASSLPGTVRPSKNGPVCM